LHEYVALAFGLASLYFEHIQIMLIVNDPSTYHCTMAEIHMHTRRKILANMASILLAGALSMTAVATQAENTAAQIGTQPSAALVMVEQQGCIYCARWNAEIAPIYPKTPEGHFAPLRRIDLHDPRPDDLTFDGPLVITPTFVLTIDGHEVARIEGYGGDELFWAMLTVTLRNHSDFAAYMMDDKRQTETGGN
jgi:hypothetical protein